MRCYFGFHQWNRWYLRREHGEGAWFERKCLSCGKREQREMDNAPALYVRPYEFLPPKWRFWEPEVRDTPDPLGGFLRCKDCWFLLELTKDRGVDGWEPLEYLPTQGDRVAYPHHELCPTKENPE